MIPWKNFVHKEHVNVTVPYSSGLFQSVERFPQLAYDVLSAILHKSFGLLHVDFHVRIAIKECGLHVHMMYPQAHGHH